MLKSVLIVGAGSFIGGALRYLISMAMKGAGSGLFPWPTFAVNLAGCFLIGIVYALFARHGSVSHPMCLMLTTGVCGGFTTFSTFGHEGLSLLQGGNAGTFIVYAVASVLTGLLLVGCGYWLVKLF